MTVVLWCTEEVVRLQTKLKMQMFQSNIQMFVPDTFNLAQWKRDFPNAMFIIDEAE